MMLAERAECQPDISLIRGHMCHSKASGPVTLLGRFSVFSQYNPRLMCEDGAPQDEQLTQRSQNSTV